MLKIASWNVNSIRARLSSVLPWLDENQPTLLAIQETKVENAAFPEVVFQELGFHTLFHGQKSYNGVAMLSKEPLTDVKKDEECRILAGTLHDLRIVNVYVPNGQAVGTDKYHYKLQWFERFHDFVQKELAQYPKMILLGDFNVAPSNEDIYDPQAWEGQVLASEPERLALQKLFHLGFKDSFRLFHQETGLYSWWDYRAAAFRRNMGLRIDLILLSPGLVPCCKQSEIDKTPRSWDKPSDHAPTWIVL